MSRGRTWRVYQDLNDWWIGYYRGDEHHYVCLLPTIVLRWRRRDAEPEGLVTFRASGLPRSILVDEPRLRDQIANGGHEHTFGAPLNRGIFPGDPTMHRYCTGCTHFQFRDGPDQPWIDAAAPRESRP